MKTAQLGGLVDRDSSIPGKHFAPNYKQHAYAWSDLLTHSLSSEVIPPLIYSGTNFPINNVSCH
jgi:hypothetical protein